MEPVRILLVDDEADFLASTTRALSRRGFAVRTAGSGGEALEELAREVPDIVVLDLRMEGMGGIEVLRRIREDHGDLPVLILTGHGDAPSAMAGIRLEIVDFLQKPVDVEQLAERIRSVVSGEAPEPLRERTVADLMVDVGSYRRVREDRSVREAIGVLMESAAAPVAGRSGETGHRSILVVDADDRVIGVLRRLDVLRMIQPEYLRDSPYSSWFTGMFLAQCKVLGDRPVGACVEGEEMHRIRDSAPLMEAVHLMSRHGLINLPVFRGERMVGMLRDRDIFLEIAHQVLGR